MKKVKMKKKIMFIIASLNGGGAEKVLVNIVNNLSSYHYKITLVLFEKKGSFLDKIQNHIEIIDLKKKNRYSFFVLILKLSFCIRKTKPNTVISFMEYANYITIFSKLLSLTNFKLILTTHCYLSESFVSHRLNTLKKLLIKILYNYSDHIVVPSVGVMKDLTHNFNCAPSKVKVIHHPLNFNEINVLKEEPLKRPGNKTFILSIGRLSKEKGYDYLIKSYSKICHQIEEDLYILGKGPEETNLKNLTHDLKIDDRVYFLGFQSNPFKFIKNAKLFILSSIFESFAIVIIEALACSTPVISTDCPFGPGEIITNGKNGILIPIRDEKAIANSIFELIKNEAAMKELAMEGRKRAEDFSLEKIIPLYEKIL